MATEEANPLVHWYENRIGRSSTRDEAVGYWVFVLGVIVGFFGILLVLLSDVESFTRGAGSALAGIALILLLMGPVLRLPLKKSGTYIASLGAVMCLLAVVWFGWAYPEDFGTRFDGQEVEIIALYGLGVLLIAIGGVFTPLLTSPREEQEAAEARAAEAEAERDAAASEAEKQAQEATEQAELAADERQQREALEQEIAAIQNSQSQFELYTDSGGNHRWRLRHRNQNIVADSAQGYSSRQKAQQGLNAVKRDALGAGVLDLDKVEDVAVEATDDAVEGADAPTFVADETSQSTFEVYEDAEGKHRWRLRHENGNIIADSGEGYAAAGGRDDAVERVRHYVQAAEYLRIEPAAFELYRDAGGKYRWRLLHENGNILADSGQGYASRQKTRQGIDSVQSNADESNAEFEVYEDNAGEHRWRLRHENGNIIADSGEGYASKQGAEDAVERVREYAPEGHVLDIGTAAFEIYEDAEGKWRWRLRHRNGNVLADSGQGYEGRPGAEDGVDSVKRDAPDAAVEETDE